MYNVPSICVTISLDLVRWSCVRDIYDKISCLCILCVFHTAFTLVFYPHFWILLAALCFVTAVVCSINSQLVLNSGNNFNSYTWTQNFIGFWTAALRATLKHFNCSIKSCHIATCFFFSLVIRCIVR